MILYHGTSIANIDNIKANSKSHKTGMNVAYFTSSRVYALICCRIPSENFVTVGLREDGKLHYFERFPLQLETLYKNKKGFLYKVKDTSNFIHTSGFTYESIKDVRIDEVEIVDDVYEQIIEEINAGNLVMHTYDSIDKKEQEMMAEHIREVDMKDPRQEATWPFYQLHFSAKHRREIDGI